MFSKVINYGIRGLIVLLGILLLSGIIYSDAPDPAIRRVFGGVCILYGIYRIAVYKMKSRTYDFQNKEDEVGDENKNL